MPRVTNYVRGMPDPLPASSGSPDLKAQLDQLAREYHATANVAAFRERLDRLIAAATPDAPPRLVGQPGSHSAARESGRA